jgi:PAS domain S-box-containing protein
MSTYKTITVISKKDEEILRLSRRVLEDSPDLIAVVGTDYKYYYINPAYAGVHGLQTEDILGRNIRDFVGDNDFEAIVRPNLEKCRDGKDVRYEEWFDFPSVGVKYMEVRYLPLRDDRGNIDRIAVILRDMTPQKKAEGIRVEQERLRTVIELAGTYNHEINNPLCSLSGYLELIQMGEIDTKLRSYLEKAIADTRRITDVTRKLSEATAIDRVDYPGGGTIVKVHAGEETPANAED